MDAQLAAIETLKIINKAENDHVSMYEEDEFETSHVDNACSKEHIKRMLKGIIGGCVQHEKALRWLCWAQSIICRQGLASLEELKLINKES